MPNPLSMWKKTGVPGEKPRLSGRVYTAVHDSRGHDIKFSV